MTNLLSATQEFMARAKQLPSQGFPIGATDPHRVLRRVLLNEEFKEYSSAELNNDVVEIADGLCDVIVIAWGTLLSYFGEDIAHEIAAEVIRSNLSKVDGTLGPTQFREDGKVIKPEGWMPPDIEGVLRRNGFLR